MKLVIDIPADVYTRLFDNGVECIAKTDISEITKAIRKGETFKTGHWIDSGLDMINGDSYTCSKCGGFMIGASKFCPDCGCRMFKEGEK